MSFNALFQKLPVGIEVYDERGQLVDLNRTDENLFAISRKDIMGINLFENPNFPEDKIARLKHGEMVVFDCNYEFDNIQTNEYYNIDPKNRELPTEFFETGRCIPLSRTVCLISGSIRSRRNITGYTVSSFHREHTLGKTRKVHRSSNPICYS